MEDNSKDLNGQIQLDNINVMNDIKKISEEDDKAIRSTKEKGESKIRQNPRNGGTNDYIIGRHMAGSRPTNRNYFRK